MQVEIKFGESDGRELTPVGSAIITAKRILAFQSHDSEQLASMTEDDFKRAFAHSPIKRAKYRGWLRNLCVAMGNSGDRAIHPMA